MKKLILTMIIFAGLFSANAQNLKEVYRQNSVVKLTADGTYAQGNEWNKIFDTYYNEVSDKAVGNRNTLTIMEDGSALVSHYKTNRHSIFDTEGRFIKDIVIKDKTGKAVSNTRPVKGYINGHFYTQPDNMGKMYFFDIDGNIIKELTLNYSTNNIITLSDNKIAVSGNTSWRGKYKWFVSIVDIRSGKDNIIWELIQEGPSSVKSDDNLYVIVTPSEMLKSMARKEIGLALIDNQLYVSLPLTGEILIYNTDGNLQSKKKMTWADKYISAEEQKETQQKIIDNYKSKLKENSDSDLAKHVPSLIERLEESLNAIKDSIPAPAFSTMIKDSDNNLLFFEYIEDEGQNKFNVWVYNENGYTCQSSLQCDNYILSITPTKLVFHNGYIYGIQDIKGAEGVPTRLVRFALN
ncbi:MAG: hypothetical protein PHE45_07035 [Bacteroidales bacterium]|nr:hypothetical protein [Bacteroidales bacterium]